MFFAKTQAKNKVTPPQLPNMLKLDVAKTEMLTDKSQAETKVETSQSAQEPRLALGKAEARTAKKTKMTPF